MKISSQNKYRVVPQTKRG